MSTELYYNPFCTACGGADKAENVRAMPPVRWIDATMHLEAAARLGITRLPALVVDGKLAAQGPRALARMRDRFPVERNVR
ncbi:MAG: glutaredoxin [Xanthomonadales bacterium]|nr:glutaredoxin [Xanthomonadales bacterium]OJY84117.1 MAG: hypothetical protein BGP23_16255 [Xanthomonadales bacterium 66-474]